MKKIAASLLFLCLALSAVHATDKYWDINGTNAGSGQTTGAGTWNTTGLNWTTNSDGTSAATTFASGNNAFFSAGTDATNAFTIGVPSAITAGALTIEEGTVTLNGPAAVTTGTNAITINSEATLKLPSSLYIVATTGGKIILDGGTIQNTTTMSAGDFVSTFLTITVTTNNGILAFNTANILNIIQPASVISGPGSITKTGVGVLALAVASTYKGSTTVSNGELRVRTSSNVFPTGTQLNIIAPGIFNLNGLSQQIESLTGTGRFGTCGGTLTISGTNNTTFYGAISNIANAGGLASTTGVGSLTKKGTNTITFAGTNDINGTITLSAGGITTLTNAFLCGPLCNLTINGGTLILSNFVQNIKNLSGTNGTIILGDNHTLISVPATSATNSSAITGPGGFTYSPTSNLTQTLNGVDTYTGPTTVTAGTLKLGTNGSLSGTASISLAAGTTFDVSAPTTPFVLSTNTSFIATGFGTNVTTLIGPAAGLVNLGSQPITLNYDGANPVLSISQGTLSLSNNPFTINAATPLAHGSYIIGQQATGYIASPGTITAGGTAFASGDVGYVQAIGGNLKLTVDVIGSNPPALPANNTGTSVLSNGTVQLSFTGSASQTYVVQATTNLSAPIVWVPISTNTSDTNGLFQFNDLDSTNYGARFYRTTTP